MKAATQLSRRFDHEEVDSAFLVGEPPACGTFAPKRTCALPNNNHRGHVPGPKPSPKLQPSANSNNL